MQGLSQTVTSRLATPLAIGNCQVNSRVLQSPLSGVTDLVFRGLVRRYAPESMLYTEMIHASQVTHVRELPKVMEIDSQEHPISMQLFDGRPDFMGEAAQVAVAGGAATIDINMGCPVNKITKKGGGSSLLRNPGLAESLVSTVVNAVSVPVTVKTRLGWDEAEITILDFARRMQDAGAQMITIHGRTRAQGYQGAARWEWIGRVKAALTVPVIANGDIVSVESAIQCLAETGADGVMCSRGTLGNPFLVGEIDQFLKTGQMPPTVTVIERLRCAQEHLQSLWCYKGQRGIQQARKHMTWYVKGFAGAAELRDQLCVMDSVATGLALLESAILRLQNAADALP
ncbi:tRNA dihydrouridine synthase DusB [Synechococcales cyanobacterium C]|uniref:tRNA-dihydrouridine synthase n=1 Tax=Petrachloros mirabilis ULC683 TaxID=2781853 RepID=A0A8K1ZXW2_9CYAN|nr:tRNA dihydrouridine synthase DusB [Petrachloros mirabilis]NCJ06903.1 tRNA dihydrouridine synthase DusB [Petrachloros mirabilis ULC683]